jgi:hypothetical protein
MHRRRRANLVDQQFRDLGVESGARAGTDLDERLL